MDVRADVKLFKVLDVRLRIRKICSETYDYFYFSRLLVFQLVQRGYTYNYLSTVVRNIFKKDRLSLLPYKKKNNLPFVSNNTSFFVMPFNKSNININDLVYKSFFNLKQVFDLGDRNIKVVNSVNSNLKRILIHGGSLSLKKFGFKCSLCLRDKCRTCPFFQNKEIIDFDGKFSLPIFSNCNCISKFCIYILHCDYCNAFYIGETTQTFEKRLDSHRSNIRCFKPYEKEYSDVAAHFNKKGHNHLVHLKSYVIACDIFNDDTRLDIESEMIHLFLLFGCKLINSKLLRHIERFCSVLT